MPTTSGDGVTYISVAVPATQRDRIRSWGNGSLVHMSEIIGPHASRLGEVGPCMCQAHHASINAGASAATCSIANDNAIRCKPKQERKQRSVEQGIIKDRGS